MRQYDDPHLTAASYDILIADDCRRIMHVGTLMKTKQCGCVQLRTELVVTWSSFPCLGAYPFCRHPSPPSARSNAVASHNTDPVSITASPHRTLGHRTQKYAAFAHVSVSGDLVHGIHSSLPASSLRMTRPSPPFVQTRLQYKWKPTLLAEKDGFY